MSLLDDVKDYPVSKWGPAIAPHHARTILNVARRARQFIFDDEASRTLGHFIRECPDVIVDNLEFVVPPYDATYVEVNLREMLLAIGRPTTATVQELAPFQSDFHMGMLYFEGQIFNLANSEEQPRALVVPFGGVDWRYAKRADLRPESVDDSAELMLGSSFNDLKKNKIQEFQDRFGFAAWCRDEDLQKNVDFVSASSGSIRDYVAALLLLYQRKHVTLFDRPVERKISHGKMRTFMAHSTVHISLAPGRDVRRSFAIIDRNSPRRHEVMTHYAHRHTDFHCEHLWSRLYENKDQWTCSLCGGLRWLRKSHLRGDASLGFVTKEYEVTS